MAGPVCRHDKRARVCYCTLHSLPCRARNAFDCVDRTHLWHWNLLRERARRYLRGFGSQDFIVQHDPFCRAWSDRLHDDTVDCSRVLSDACEIKSPDPPQTRPRFNKLVLPHEIHWNLRLARGDLNLGPLAGDFLESPTDVSDGETPPRGLPLYPG